MINILMVQNKMTTMQAINLVDATVRKAMRRKIAPDWRVSMGGYG